MKKLAEYPVENPRVITLLMAALTVVIGLTAAVPSIWPDKFPGMNKAVVDTDPENMLPADEPVRVFHKNMKKQFNLHDMIVVGVVNEKNPQGVFNAASLKKIYDLAKYAETIKWQDEKDPKKTAGVIGVDLMALSTVDNIEPAGPGTIKFEWLMQTPPASDEEAAEIRRKAQRIPMFSGTLVSDGDKKSDGTPAPPKAAALYIPLTDKHLSYKVATKLEEKIAEFGDSDDEFHITGLPVAEDTFGVEMFIQMAVSAPLAMLVIFLLMWYFFHKLQLIISPMIIAIACIIQTMGLLIITGNTIHIMSSMIPIFIMPIAVLDAIHILSEFFDRYQDSKDRKTAIKAVMATLFKPMLFTSLTTAVGFASLALTPIPPVQVFGIFIAFGVMMAWLWTVLFIPAYIMFIKPESLENFGLKQDKEDVESHSIMSRILHTLGTTTYRRAKLVLALFVAVLALAFWGISKININDNPVKWFEEDHRIRIADRKLNSHFAGTYMAYLTIESDTTSDTLDPSKQSLINLINNAEKYQTKLKQQGYEKVDTVFKSILKKASEIQKQQPSRNKFLNTLVNFASQKAESKTTPEDQIDTWYEAATFIELEKSSIEAFKDPAMLRWVAEFQDYLLTVKGKDGRKLVGKSSSLADIVRTVYRELLGGKEKDYIIPNKRSGVAQTLMQYQNGHRPDDLWHFVEKPDQLQNNPGFRSISLWVQLKSGDNKDMSTLVAEVNSYMKKHPAPQAIKHNWFGLTYINVIWQEKMVAGMLNAFLGSFVVVLIMMIFLFRSILWGILSMIPLTVTIAAIYGLIGFIGKDYDMPVAVLSSLSLGLAVDYAIHFLARSRELRSQNTDWQATVQHVFGEPARAITRNVMVVGIGFLPLLAAPLVPYQTVGFFIAAILITAGLASLLILPAIITVFERYLFKERK